MARLTTELQILDALPEGLLQCHADQLARFLGGPTLIRLEGERDPPMFVSVLLHGNEVSGWNGLREWLLDTPSLPRSLRLFIGNVAAAEACLRTLPTQQDFNRIWKDAGGDEGRLAASVRDTVLAEPLFAAIDLHNNTGHNPHYAVLTDLTPENRSLALMFSDHAVLVEEPDTVLARIFEGHCPAVTLELGPISDAACAERARDYLDRCFQLCSRAELIQDDVDERLVLYRSLARVHVQDSASFSFVDDRHDTALLLTGGLEGVNFHSLPAGTEFGVSPLPLTELFSVLDPLHRDVTGDFFSQIDDRIVLKRGVTPAMYTTDPVVVRQDCLCYFMEPFNPWT